MTAEAAGAYMESECEKKLKENPDTQPICEPEQCAEFRETEPFHQACAERSMYSPVVTVGCYNVATGQWTWAPPKEIFAFCKAKAREDPNWELEQCFCCCVGGAEVTAVAVADEAARPIEEIDKGDTVLSGHLAAGRVEWGPASVAFSQGTVGEETVDTIRIAFAGGDGDRGLTVSPDQPLLLADGELTRAAELVPGQHLMGVDGGPVAVGEAERGRHASAVHHIATGQDWDGSPDGHLIQANGVVLGDFVLQLHYPELVPAAAEA